MRRHHLWIYALLIAGLAASGCSDDDNGTPSNKDTGTTTKDTGTTEKDAGADSSATEICDNNADDDGDGQTDCDDSDCSTDPACSTTDGGTDAQAATACASYCTAAMTNCTGDNAIYTQVADCEAACSAMPEGAPTDTSGNTAWCRAYHAGAAAGDPGTHCPHAGISSQGDTCGTACEAYCDQVMANCTGGDEVFADRAACEAACAGVPSDGDWNAVDGDSLQCRAYHASFPAAGDSTTHCPHAGGAAPCAASN